MSAEQEKESCKRARGDDILLDGLSRSGAQQASPEKKKRKSSLQGSWLTSVSEYAPPANTSSDHLIASNPFDDDYNVSTPSSYRYFGNPGFAAAEDFNHFRMPPNMSPRTSSRFCGPYAFRDQTRPFPQDPIGMAFGRAPSFNMEVQENSNYENQSFFNSVISQTINLPGQHFRSNRNEDFHPLMMHSSTQMNNLQSASCRGLSRSLNLNPHTETSHHFIQSQSHFMHPKMSTSKQDFQPAPNRISNPNSSAQNRKQNSDAIMNSALIKNRKGQLVDTEDSHSNCADHLNGGHTNGTRGKFYVPKSAKADVTPNEKCNKWLLQSYCGHLSSDSSQRCGICTLEVNNFQDAIECEASCQKWFHRTCTGMTEIAYALLTAEASAVWGCDSCMANKDIQLVRTGKAME
ncbi:pygopus homolog 1 [Rhinophrynus dorsalis]